MIMLWPLGFLLCVFLQSHDVPSLPPGILDLSEKSRFERATDVERRIKIYQDASVRIQRTIQQAMSRQDFQIVPGILKTWTNLLSASLKDIEANLNVKKKSKALKNYEIQVRKAIAAISDSKVRAPVDQQDIFNSCLSQAETVRKRFVELLFRLEV